MFTSERSTLHCLNMIRIGQKEIPAFKTGMSFSLDSLFEIPDLETCRSRFDTAEQTVENPTRRSGIVQGEPGRRE